MNAITKIAAAFQVLVPVIKEQRVKFITASLEDLEKRHGNLGPARRKLYNTWGQDGAMIRQFARFLTPIEKGNNMPGAPVKIDAAAIEKASQQEAELEVAAFVKKLEGKLGDLTKAKLVWASGPAFKIVGDLGERRVVVEQDIIVNVSKLGKLFNQFPARIYVDGKRLSEKKFKELPR